MTQLVSISQDKLTNSDITNEEKEENFLNVDGHTIYSYEQAIDASIKYFEGDELAARVFVDKYALRDNDNNILEDIPEKMHWRLAKEFARIEKKKYKNTNIKPLSDAEIFQYFDRFHRIVPQGSPLYGIGNPYQYVSIGNCFVVPDPEDSYLGIMRTDTDITSITCRRGGVGWSLDKLRPAGLSVKNAAKTTSGSMSFAKRFSNTIREVGQFGRRGASLQCMTCVHPDISHFINSKRDGTQITGSNISVKFTDEFMQAVEQDKDIELKWPINSEQPKIIKIVKAKNIWDEFIDSAWQSAEPGCIYIDTVHKESNCVPYGMVEHAANPCGEQFLPPYCSCRLILLNLMGYIINPYTNKASFNWELFQHDCEIIQRLADDMVDLEIESIDKIIDKLQSDPEPPDIKRPGLELWQNIKEASIKDRRTGCGITALGDCLAALNMKYASDESIEFAEKMQRTYKTHVYKSSIEMSKELGPFPIYDKDKDIESNFIKKFKQDCPNLYKDMIRYGRRNMMLMTISPAGSVSCLTQTTSGMEPVFQLKYTRRKKGNPGDSNFRTDFVDDSGDHWQHFEVYHKGLKTWLENNPNSDIEDSPYYESTANEIDWVKKLYLQQVLNKHIDNSISNTTNLPRSISKEKVSEIYMTGWRLGLKGVTIYRDGCRSGVLISNDENKENIKKNDATKRPHSLSCHVFHPICKGEEYYTIVGLLNNEPYEVFTGLNKENAIPKSIEDGEIVKEKRGRYKLQSIYSNKEWSCILNNGHSDENADALTRMISTSLRHGVDISFIVHQLEKTRGDLQSFARVLARTLKRYIKDGVKVTGEECPECKNTELIRQEGCVKCPSCTWTKCS